MNWGLIGAIAGVALTFYGIRFVLDLMKSLFGKDARKRMIETLGDKVSDANESLTTRIKIRAEQRKEEKRRKKMEEDNPMIIIR